MAWIAWANGLTQREEVLRIAGSLDIDPRLVAACCMLVWEWADGETEDGGTNVPFLSLTCHIDRVTGVPGFGAAFAEVGWLINDGSGAMFPNFARWNGETAKRRLKEASRKASWRKRRDKCPVDVPPNTGPEKRREEKNTKDKGNRGAGGKPKADLFALDGLPPDFHTAEFKAAWTAWVENRRDTRHPLTPRAVTIAKNKLAAWGPTKAIQALNDSTIGGWQGLFEPKDTLKPGAVPPDLAVKRRQLIEAESAAYLRQVHESDALVRAQRAARSAREGQA